MKSDKQQAIAAAAFAERWKGRGYEKGDSQVFWTELLTEVFGIENPSTFIRYEEQVKVDGKKIEFKMSAYSGDALLGEGTHLRFVVDRERFMSKL